MTNSSQLQDHPIAAAFPLLGAQELHHLAEDIQANGLLQPITLLEDKILDGRNRYRACAHVGVPPRFETYQGDDPVSFVISLNLRRRDLDASQRAMIAATLATMKHGGVRQSDQDANLHLAPSRASAAEKLGVSVRSVADAAKVQRDAVPELADAVRKGAASVSAAAAVSTLKPEEQREAVRGGRQGVAQAAKARVVSSNNIGPAPKPQAPKGATFIGVDNERQITIGGQTIQPQILNAKEGNEWEMLSVFAVAQRLLAGDVTAAAAVTRNYVIAFSRVSDAQSNGAPTRHQQGVHTPPRQSRA